MYNPEIKFSARNPDEIIFNVSPFISQPFNGLVTDSLVTIYPQEFFDFETNHFTGQEDHFTLKFSGQGIFKKGALDLEMTEDKEYLSHDLKVHRTGGIRIRRIE